MIVKEEECQRIKFNFRESSAGGILITKVKDIKNVVQYLKSQGLKCHDPHEVHPGAYSADFQDPDGNWISMSEDTNRIE